MIIPTFAPPDPSTASPEVPHVYRHPILDDVDLVDRARHREAAEHRLASASRRAAPQGTRLRTRVGALLVRAGYSLGAPGPIA